MPQEVATDDLPERPVGQVSPNQGQKIRGVGEPIGQQVWTQEKLPVTQSHR
jgi:hypothetical protein